MLLLVPLQECTFFLYTLEKAAFSSYVKTLKENEPVLPEHKIIDVSLIHMHVMFVCLFILYNDQELH